MEGLTTCKAEVDQTERNHQRVQRREQQQDVDDENMVRQPIYVRHVRSVTSSRLGGSTHTVVVERPRTNSNSAFSWCHLPPGGRVDEQRELRKGWSWASVRWLSSVPFNGMQG